MTWLSVISLGRGFLKPSPRELAVLELSYMTYDAAS